MIITKAELAEKAVEILLQKAVSAAERKSDYHAGPHDSFPIGPAGQHLQAAWDLAGHAANPDEVRANILRFAHEHGLTDHLPQAARDHMKAHGMGVKKARNEDVQQLFNLAWNHESMEGDDREKRRLVHFAHEHNLQHMLPEAAHGMMHEMGVPHNHDGMKNDQETGLHSHTIVKAFNPIALDGLIVKSWMGDAGEAHWEGWLSTPHKDLEKDVIEPEAFTYGMDLYFQKRAPVSIVHQDKNIPIGHLQKAAVVRDGKILKDAVHPTDPSDFEHFPGSGTGVWVRGVANEEPGVSAIRKGNVGGMSFIGNATEYEPLPGGRNRYLKLDPWIESTVAPYPINPQAVIAVAKAYGLTPPQEKETPTMDLNEILAEAARAVEAEKQAQAQAEQNAPLTKADLGKLFLDMQTKHDQEIAELKKAFEEAPVARGEGVGRKGTIPAQDQKAPLTFEDNPLEYTIQKASRLTEDTTELTPAERLVLNELFERALVAGLRDSDD